MGWTQQIEYVDVEITLPPPVQKQVWNGTEFVSMTLYRQQGVPRGEILLWLEKTYGQPGTYINGRYWAYNRSGNYVVMDERVYTWYQIKWGNK